MVKYQQGNAISTEERTDIESYSAVSIWEVKGEEYGRSG